MGFLDRSVTIQVTTTNFEYLFLERAAENAGLPIVDLIRAQFGLPSRHRGTATNDTKRRYFEACIELCEASGHLDLVPSLRAELAALLLVENRQRTQDAEKAYRRELRRYEHRVAKIRAKFEHPSNEQLRIWDKRRAQNRLLPHLTTLPTTAEEEVLEILREKGIMRPDPPPPPRLDSETERADLHE